MPASVSIDAVEEGFTLPVEFPGDGAPGTVPEMNPIQFGGVAQSSTPSDTTDGQVVRPWFDAKGRQHVINDGALSPATDAVAAGADAASSGALDMHLSDALSNTAVAVKASAGRLHTIYVHNPNAAVSFLHLYDIAAASVTVGGSTRKQSFGIPSNGTLALVLHVPLGFGTAIAIAATTTVGGSTAPGTGLTVSLGYK